MDITKDKNSDTAKDINLDNSEGQKFGYNEGLMTTIEGMLKENISLKTISKITGKGKDEILKIKNEMLN